MKKGLIVEYLDPMVNKRYWIKIGKAHAQKNSPILSCLPGTEIDRVNSENSM